MSSHAFSTQRSSAREQRPHQELDAVTPVRSGEPSAYHPPRRLKTLVGEGDKDVVDVCARGAMLPESVNMMNNIIDSAEQITGSLLKKLREEMGVGVEEMSVEPKSPESIFWPSSPTAMSNCRRLFTSVVFWCHTCAI